MESEDARHGTLLYVSETRETAPAAFILCEDVVDCNAPTPQPLAMIPTPAMSRNFSTT
jgi:hypothetical protein